jgi:hypothetical protein
MYSFGNLMDRWACRCTSEYNTGNAARCIVLETRINFRRLLLPCEFSEKYNPGFTKRCSAIRSMMTGLLNIWAHADVGVSGVVSSMSLRVSIAQEDLARFNMYGGKWSRPDEGRGRCSVENDGR